MKNNGKGLTKHIKIIGQHGAISEIDLWEVYGNPKGCYSIWAIIQIIEQSILSIIINYYYYYLLLQIIVLCTFYVACNMILDTCIDLSSIISYYILLIH